MDCKLTFDDHVTSTIAKADRSWGFIWRNSSSFKVETIKTLYYSFVKSKILYGSCIWRPIFKNSIDRLEKINLKFIRFLAFKTGSPMHTLHHSYSQNALKFKVPTINSSMNANDIIWLQKIIDHNVNL